MSGETSKKIGDLGEDFAENFLNLLGWEQLGDWGKDIACCFTDKHKSNKPGKHGLDGVYRYKDPYTLQHKVMIIEAKALSWGIGSGTDRKPRPVSSIEKELKKFVEALQAKVVCASRSKEFRDTYGVTSDSEICGLICYYVHDGYFNTEVMNDVLMQVSVKRDLFDTKVFLMMNDKIQRVSSIVSHLKLTSYGNNIPKDNFAFCNFNFEDRNASVSWSPVITLEHIFSNFLVSIISHENFSRHNIFYSGTLDNEGVKRFLGALDRFQVNKLINLYFSPCAVDKPLENIHALKQYFQNSVITYGSESYEIKIDTMKLQELSFNI